MLNFLRMMKNKFRDFDLTPKPPKSITLRIQGEKFLEQYEFDKALLVYEELLRIFPTDVECLEKLGNLKIKCGKYQEAAYHFQEAVIYKPNNVEILTNLATAYAKNNEDKKAKKLFEKVLQIDAKNQFASLMLAALNHKIPDKCPSDFIRDLFDNYANCYDMDLLKQLKYKTHRVLYTLIKQHYKKSNITAGLDLGCGTGLLGKLLKERYPNITLTGIDLSTQMLVKAKESGYYANLLNGDITKILTENINNSSSGSDFMFDLVTAADVFVYIGDLDKIFALVKKILYEGGVFCFSVENLLHDNIKLSVNGRFSHSEKYLLALCDKHGFTWQTNLIADGRIENSVPVLMNHVLLTV
jgi:predicted TPR repeat methyltransferase